MVYPPKYRSKKDHNEYNDLDELRDEEERYDKKYGECDGVS